jgi:hypothetical protein
MSSEMMKIGDSTATHSASISIGAQKKKMDDHLQWTFDAIILNIFTQNDMEQKNKK